MGGFVDGSAVCNADPDCHVSGNDCVCDYSIYCPEKADKCCTSVGGCGDGQSQWDWWTGFTCDNVEWDPDGGPTGDCGYKYDSCSAGDGCPSVGGILHPGHCNPSGCVVGDTPYKTCCWDDGSGMAGCVHSPAYTPPNDGVCQAGSSPVVNCVGPNCCTEPEATSTPGSDFVAAQQVAGADPLIESPIVAGLDYVSFR